jgi:hypothetical protein
MRRLTLDMRISRPGWIVIGIAVAALIVAGIVVPVSHKLDAVAETAQEARREYLDTVKLVQRYAAVEGSAGNGKSVLLQEPLFSYVDKVTRSLKLPQRIDYVRPEERTRDDGSVVEVVHLAFKGITLPEFTTFLYHIEVRKREIFVKAISIKKDAKRNLDVQMTLQKRS